MRTTWLLRRRATNEQHVRSKEIKMWRKMRKCRFLLTRDFKTRCKRAIRRLDKGRLVALMNGVKGCRDRYETLLIERTM